MIAFTDYNPFRGIWGSEWVGFGHFTRFLSSPDFLSYLANTLKLSMLGTELNLHTTCEGDNVVMVISTMNLKEYVKMGDAIKFDVPSGVIQLFDKETSNNLIWYDEVSSKANAPVCKEYKF